MAAARKKAAVAKAEAKPVKATRRRKASSPAAEAAAAKVMPKTPAVDAMPEAANTATASMPEMPAEPDEAFDPAEVVQPAAGSVIRKGKTLRYLLPANMEIAALGPVHRELVALEASNDGPFVLDGANLSVIDTAGLQLLISFVSAVQASGKKVSWDNYSVQAYHLANELGLVDQLGD